ncbi:MAG TPA: hypothetical protein VM571_09800 [Noviherbaspirillum sp.]|jgi:hypothetical protein|nr:hypothetical protein [Noviherbaspirillum sp.]
MAKKAAATKTVEVCVYKDDKLWNVQYGHLKRGKGNPGKTEHLFRVVGEKLPFDSLAAVKRHVTESGFGTNGVYVAHDSMGFPRYIGRGSVFGRLKTRKDAQELELIYFSFYIVSEKKHEREIETLLIRAAGPLLQFNTKKKRVGILPGNIRDYEAGTYFYERQYKKGR